MSDVNKTIQKWHVSFRKGTDFDSWGQLVEAIDEYQIETTAKRGPVNKFIRLHRGAEENFGKNCIMSGDEKWQSAVHTVQGGLQVRRAEETGNHNSKYLTYNKVFPFDVQPVPLRRILAPGEEEHLELEEEEDAAAGAGSTEAFPPRAPGTLLPRLPSEHGMTLLTLKIEKIGLKDAGQCIDPYMTVSLKDLNGLDVYPVQDTPVASRKEDTYIHFSVDVDIQRHVEKIPKGAAIFFEFKHYKPKKGFTSTKCFAFMEMDEIKPGPIVIELYKKPTDFREEETAAPHKETTLSPSPPDVTQGQLSLGVLNFKPTFLNHSLTHTSMWKFTSSHPAILNQACIHYMEKVKGDEHIASAPTCVFFDFVVKYDGI
ncbi:hypothetical protein F7725_019762 [Dissostichus mawsoni]|uniref:C2 Aida-type domain-containing protein n=1 Tax=Dissostichus mawsoni TaxID=36200 RepID=A0A7J5YLL1_DISMA|nr:hypothetical protein F7725_019762 [Dissostichus mawsoni]